MQKPKSYNIQPSRGQALLNFQGRRFPDKVELFETEIVEEIKQKKKDKEDKQKDLNSDFRNLLIHGDALSACAYLKDKNIKLDLVYIDPPFASGAKYVKKIFLRNGVKESIESEDASIGEEVMYNDIWQKEDYLNWLYERLLAIKEVMNSGSCIFLHLDYHIGHYAKIMMDEVFGEENFVNEIVVKRVQKNFAEDEKVRSLNNAYDTILLYSTDDDLKIIPPRDTSSNDGKENWHSFDAPNWSGGRANLVYELFGHMPPPGNVWRWEKKRAEEAIKKGVLRPNSRTGKPEYKVSQSGKMVNNLWTDIPAYAFTANYVTEKSEKLLNRIIEIASEKDMVIGDFFVGSGTTVKSAFKLKRKFVACDIGLNSIQTTRDELLKIEADFDVLKVRDGVRLFRNPAQTTAKIFSLIDGFQTRKELELSEFWDGGIADKSAQYIPVKFVGIDKRLTKELLDIVLEEIYQLQDSSSGVAKAQLIYAYKDDDINQTYINKQISNAGKTTIKLELINLDELLASKRDLLYLPDSADIELSKEKDGYKVKIKRFFSPYLKTKIDDYNNKKVKKTKQTTIDEEQEPEQPKKKVTISDTGLELIEAVQFDTTLKKDIWTSNLELEDKAGIKEKIKGEYLLPTAKFLMKIRNIAGDEIIIDSSELNSSPKS